MKFANFCAVAVMVSFLSGCASQPTVPDWVTGNSTKYKSELYLTGRGQASTQEEAKDRARADLAKVFQVAVVVSSEDIQRSKSDASGAPQYEEQASRYISTRTDKIVSGIQIAELWQDPTTLAYHALAILPRLQAGASLRQQIGELDDATRNYVEQSRRSDDLFVKIGAADSALQLQQEREGLQKSLQVVDITGRGVEPQWSSAKLKADLGELLKRVRIAPRVTAGSPAGLAEMVGGAMAQAGFVPDATDHPEFILQANLNLADLGYQEGWYWQRGALEVTLSEAATGRIRGTKRWGIKGNGRDKESALRRAMDQADAVLKQELGTTIVGMMTAR